MDDIAVAAASKVTEADLANAKMGSRFGRMDLFSQLAVLAVESLGINFEALEHSRIGVCLVASAGSLPTDIDYWKSRKEVGGPSPTLFAYTLPSSAIGEMAIRYRITGPNLCFVGTDAMMLAEAKDLIARDEVDSCVCVSCNVITVAAAEMIRMEPMAEAQAAFLVRGKKGAGLDQNHVTLSESAH